MTRTRAPADTRARSTPVVPSAFLNDHASDDDAFRLLPPRPFQDRTISNASISEENYFFEWRVWVGFAEVTTGDHFTATRARNAVGANPTTL